MTKQFVTLLLLSISVARLSAQTQPFRFGAALSLGASDGIFHFDSDPSGLNTAAAKLQTYRFSHGLTIWARRDFSRRWSLQAGLGYQQSGYRQKKTPVALQGGGGPGYPLPNLVAVESRVNYTDLVLPVNIRYHFIANKNSWYVAAGVAPALKLVRKQDSTSYYDNGTQNKTTARFPGDPFRPFNLHGQAGIGLALPLKSGHEIFFQPTVGYTFFSSVTYNDFSTRILQLSLQMGFVW